MNSSPTPSPLALSTYARIKTHPSSGAVLVQMAIDEATAKLTTENVKLRQDRDDLNWLGPVLRCASPRLGQPFFLGFPMEAATARTLRQAIKRARKVWKD